MDNTGVDVDYDEGESYMEDDGGDMDASNIYDDYNNEPHQ